MYEDIKNMIGKTFVKVEQVANISGDDSLVFEMENGDQYIFYHAQDCCENVYIEDICGDLADLVGTPILHAEESTSEGETPEGLNPPSKYCDSFTWTFYKFSTIKGSVTVRWLGESNGYYSERVDLRFRVAR